MKRRDFVRLSVCAAGAGLSGCGTGCRGGADAARLRVGVISDIHLLTANDPKRRSDVHFEKALRHYDARKADAVLLCGDIGDCGLVAELEYAAEIWSRVFPGGRRSDGAPVETLFLLGDHDLGGYAHKYPWAKKCSRDPDAVNHPLVQADVAAVWARLFHEPWAPVQTKTVKGYTFVLAHFPLNGGTGTGDLPIVGLAEALAAANTDRAKPFFFATHRPVYGTLPWKDHAPADILAKSANHAALAAHPNVVAFFGHCHRNGVDEQNLWQGAYTAIHVPSARYCGTRPGRENSVLGGKNIDPKRPQQMPGADNLPSNQALFLEVFGDRLVVSRRDLAHDGPLGPDWTIPLPAPDGACTEAARAARAGTPAFPAGAAATVTAGVGKDRARRERPEVVVSFPPAHAADGRPRAFDYEVTAQPAADGKPLVRRVFSSHPFVTEAADAAPVRCVFAAHELAASGTVTFTVRPANAFGAAGAPLPPVTWRA